MNSEQRYAFFNQLKTNNSAPETELEYSSPFELLVAVLLSAQATDVSVNKGTRLLFKIANSPTAFLKLGEAGIRPFIQHIGLYRTKGKHLQETCRILVDKHQSQVPRTREELEALPGVGRKTANVILNTAFGEPTIAVDTHIFRVSNRTGLAPGKDVNEVEQQLLKRVPAEFLQDAHHWLILHGRYVCKARSPDCDQCIVEPLCRYQHKTSKGKISGDI